MARQIKKVNHKSLGDNQYSNKFNENISMIKGSDYQFEIGDRCEYIGGVYEFYKNKSGTITKQSKKGHRVDYSVLFDDGKELNYIMEKVLKPVGLFEDGGF